MVGGGNDVLQAVWTNGVGCVLCGCVREVAVGKGRKEVRKSGFVMKKEGDRSCVKPELDGGANLGC